MFDDVCLPMVAMAALSCCLWLALRQRRGERSDTPTMVWREASNAGSSEWIDLDEVSPSAAYSDVLAAVRRAAHPGVSAVQFASVVRPQGAPDHTLRVLFMSGVRDPAPDRTSINHC
ncbi:MAG: hypothetical protein ABW001_11515 [Mycobacterium sp.]